jgi:hypothetical protein
VLAVVASIALTGCGNSPYPSASATSTHGGGGTAKASGTPTEPTVTRSATPSVSPSTATAPALLLDPSPCAGAPWIDPAARNGGTPAPPRFHEEKLPAGFRPVLLIECREEERTTPSDGEWTYIVEYDATEGLDAVAAAVLAPPPAAATGQVFCQLSLTVGPFFLLVDATGRVVLPSVPRDSCQRPVDVGLSQVQFTAGRAFKVQQQFTPAELATDCAPRFKGPLGMLATGGSATPFRGHVTLGRTPTSVCVYRTGSDPEVGEFRGGTPLTAAQGGDLLRALQKVGPGDPSISCRAATDFAVVMAGGEYLHVELNGCRRVMPSGGSAYTAAAPDIVAALNRLQLKR